MPAPGEQHKTSSVVNPFDEAKLVVSEYTAQEIATLQSRLGKQLGPEYISSRPGASGQKVHYIAAEKCINLANEVFGFNGWSSTIKEIQVDFVDENSTTGKISLGLSVIVRVTLRDGTFHEDIGYGHIENCKGKAAAFEKAKKEGTTDGLKRALRNFGNVLGNCVYDKDYLSKVTKLKVAPAKWGVDNLHRHVDYAPAKKDLNADTDGSRPLTSTDTSAATMDCEDEFGTADFDEADFSITNADHPDEISLDAPATTVQPPLVKSSPATAMPRSNVANISQARPPVTGREQMTNPGPMGGPANPMIARHPPQQAISAPVTEKTGAPMYKGLVPNQQQSHGLPHGQMPQMNLRGLNSNPQPLSGPGFSPSSRRPGPPPNTESAVKGEALLPNASSENDPPVGFFTARVAETVQNANAMPSDIPTFNPHLESPSIRKTAGIDHTRTGPVARDLINGAPPGNISMPPRPNFTNMLGDQARRIGMPKPAVASPLQNRGSYKPPQMVKRPADGNPVQHTRPALNDVTSASVNVPQDLGTDIKRQKLSNGLGAISGVGSIAG